jgi:catechol 2,3-dioxygenase-like lactoylglutathione lyase family enzyme
MGETQTRTNIKQLGRVIVTVTDQDKAIDFYVGKLGFEKRADTPYGHGDRWVEVAPPGSTAAIALCPPMSGTTAGNQNTGIALTTSNLDADYDDMKAHGVDVDADIMRGGGPVPPMFWFRDLDGNTLLVVESD